MPLKMYPEVFFKKGDLNTIASLINYIIDVFTT